MYAHCTLGLPKNEQGTNGRIPSSLFLSWSASQLNEFFIDAFPALSAVEYQLMLADREKNLNLIPPDIDTPEKLKAYGIGRSALYIRPKLEIKVPCTQETPSSNEGPSGITIMYESNFISTF